MCRILYNKRGIDKENPYGNQSFSIFFGSCKGTKHYKSSRGSAVPASDMPRCMNVQSELASWFGDYYGKINVAFTSNLSTNGAVMVSAGLAYFLVIEGAV